MKQQVLSRIKQNDPSNQQEWAIHARCHPSITKGHSARTPKPIQPEHPDNGMEKLLNTGDNLLTLVMSTNAIMVGSVIKETKLHAESRSTLTSKTVFPNITT